jgi:hypothetical protein
MISQTRLPKYCNKCGKELLVNEVYTRYDIYSGEAVDIVKTFSCPDFVRSFLGSRTNGHYNERIDVVDGQVVQS